MIWLIWVSVLAGSFLILAGDVSLKEATQKEQYYNFYVLIGAGLYASSAPFWAYVIKMRDLPDVGIIYGISMVVGLYLLGWFWYEEIPNWKQHAAVVLTITAVVLIQV